MALFELKQHYADTEEKWTAPAFKECAVADIHLAFFNGNEHAENRKVDGKTALVVVEESTLKVRSSHWEAGAKQNFDTGLYTAYTILYIQAKDYGPKPKVGKQLVLSVDSTGEKSRTYEIKSCEDEDGVFRMALERVRQ